MLYNRTLRKMFASVALAAIASPAFALDGADLVAKLNAANSASGLTVTYGNIAVDGDTLTLQATKVTPTGGEALELGDITLEGVEEDGDGGYRIETVSFPDINRTEGDTTIVASDIQLGGLTIPAKADGKTLDTMLFYETATTGPITVTNKGKEVFSTSRIEGRIERRANDAGMDFDGSVSDIKADLTTIQDPKGKDTIEKLGLQTIEGKIDMKGSWELGSGLFSVDEYAFDFNDVGRLNLAFAISGYTLDFMNTMREAVETAQANPNREEANNALGMSMLGMLQQLTFNSAEISFNDASLTKKVLDVVGAEQGVSGDQMAQSLKGLVPLMIAQLNMPELQNQISQAVNTYLDDPKSLKITAAPANPVPFPMIMGAAMGAPNTIPQVLGVTVTAND
ncbi:hypothetical protein [Mycoplana rhizolycopersici]|uniref:Transmembrane protein n=1 Tax=Mycoplana rhizolycopersici TaxID=2746702 RepID=A0ABX2Q9K7_9HYPH|nr:hypothetical protein [Rhizobium rhizolycopersici]NVP54410.1 hypothetical protein [Rhizobium rhizolycopersici]